MKAMVLEKVGAELALMDLPKPKPSKGQVQLQVHEVDRDDQVDAPVGRYR